MDETYKETRSLDAGLLEIFSILLHRLVYIILITMVISAAVFFYMYRTMTPLYRASAKIYVQNASNPDLATANDINAATYLVRDCQQVLVSWEIMQPVKERLNLSESAEQLSSRIVVNLAQEETRVLQIDVSYPNAEMAAKIANEICYVAQEKLPGLLKLQTAKMINPALVPQNPYTPNYLRTVGFVALATALLSALMFVLFGMLNDRVKTPEDIEKYTGLTVLGMIPTAKKSGKKNR